MYEDPPSTSSPAATIEGEEIMKEAEHNLLVEPENEIVEDNMNVCVDEIRQSNGVIVPVVGMKFKDEKEVFEFYKRYAYGVGFPVRKRNSKKDDDGVVCYVTLTCSREGQRSGSTSGSLKPQPTMQTGCKARISAAFDYHGFWVIKTVHLDHNHKPSPSKSRLYRCNRELSAHVKRKMEVNDIAGIPLHKSFNSAVVEAGGYENLTCVEKDCRNYIEQVRRLKLGEGDAAAIQSYFSEMQARCAGFYFSIDLDEESRLKNVFWADNRCRQAYKEFGDVVTFDTTYLTNKYDMPFAPFVGVNHHGQSILFGCGLLSNENTDTFMWLFRTWLTCMQGQAPHGIITDQDRAMQNAIQAVFPNTKHRWCLWHIMKKLPEKFGYHVAKGSIFSAMHTLVYDSQNIEEFEDGWRTMIDKYELQDNDWLLGLYENRGRWVPCFLKTIFWAGMSTTQRSESMNAFFDGYVHAKTSLKQFVEQYERALRSKVEKEFQADFKSFSQIVPCVTTYEMEKQFQTVYTISKFREVQSEFTGKMYCDIVSTVEGSLATTYRVREDVLCGEQRKKKTYTVLFHLQNREIVCSCHLFEFRGIVCRHAIAVLIRNDVTALPDRYTLRRWRRDVSRAHTRVAVHYDGLVSTPGQLRYDEMCKAFASVADLATEDDGQTHSIMEWIQFKRGELLSSRSTGRSNVPAQRNIQISSEFTATEKNLSCPVLDPKVARKKGAPKKLRRKSPLESTSKKPKARLASSKGNRPTSSHSCPPDGASSVQAYQEQQISTLTPFSYSQLLVGDHASQECTQHLPSSLSIHLSSNDAVFHFEGHTSPSCNPHLSDKGGNTF